MSFHITDGFKGTGEPVSCEASNDDSDIINSTLLADVSQVPCGDPAWQFDFTSLEDDDPEKPPVGGKLVVEQTISTTSTPEAVEARQAPKVFRGAMTFQANSFARTVRSKHDSALTRYVGVEEGIITSTQVDQVDQVNATEKDDEGCDE